MEKEILRIPRPLRRVAGKFAFTLPKQLVKHANLQENKIYLLVVLNGEKKEADTSRETDNSQ